MSVWKKTPPSAMGREEFVNTFARVFEHSPWVAERAWVQGIQKIHDSSEGLHLLFEKTIRSASREEKLKLIMGHPKLAAPVPSGKDNEASRGEQARAGLASLDSEQRARFARLNDTYLDKFGFPFILAVEGMRSDEILKRFEKRLSDGNKENELDTALDEVIKIGSIRLGRM